MGFIRSLSAAEILNQYAFLTSRAGGAHAITNIVFMGMGEPLDNLSEVLTALHALTSDWGFALSPRRITVSTIGILPALQHLIEETECHIAVSLHNPYHEQRLLLMPAEKVYELKDILALLARHDWAHQRKLSFEYVMLGGLNDSPLHAKTLARLVRNLPCHINLIPYHPHSDCNINFTTSPRKAIETFQNILTEKGISCTLRTSRGQDIEAACGLLAVKVSFISQQRQQ
jgi:23S rRNA (adenine2503-C2)-methyltransferase